MEDTISREKFDGPPENGFVTGREIQRIKAFLT